MRKWLVILCVFGQVVVLAYMVGGREMIIRSGQSIFVRTAPLDPRDIFRGDFVRLDYSFNVVSSRNTKNFTNPSKGQVVYASLQPQAGGVYAFEQLSATQPDSGVFLRGRITRDRGWSEGRTLAVKFGIEQYFVEQGSGLAIEEKRGRRGEMQVPMEVELALSKKGVAVLKDFRWSALGIKIEVVRDETTGEAEQNNAAPVPPRSPRLKVTLENVSEEPLRVANPGDNCAFSLEADQRSRQTYTAVDNACKQAPVMAADLVTLAPGEQYGVELDLATPRYHLATQNDVGEQLTGDIAALLPDNRFRIVYRSPDKNNQAGASGGAELWLGELPSQAFNAGGRID